MINGLENMQQFSKDNLDTAMQSFGVASKGFQALAAEMADYSKKSFEDGSAAVEKMMGAKSLDKAVEVQTEYMKTAYEGYVGQMSKMYEMCVDMAKESYKPVETAVSKAAK
ncbi:MAG: phasin family protein [Hyphomicrobiales bacterium]|nr:phasin family protein [Hyphomicrobiales bacterium]